MQTRASGKEGDEVEPGPSSVSAVDACEWLCYGKVLLPGMLTCYKGGGQKRVDCRGKEFLFFFIW